MNARSFRIISFSFALIASMAILSPAHALPQPSINIRAWIDGRSRLTLDGDTAQWHQFEFAAPGRLDCDIGLPIQPTYIQGNAWFPDWPDVPTCENRDCNCDSSIYTGVDPALPDAVFTPALQIVSARGPCAIVEYPTAANGFHVVIEFNDDSWNAADWYEVNLVLAECGDVTHYCTSTPNSTGAAATIDISGSLSIAANDMHLVTSSCPPQLLGIFFYGKESVHVPMADGFLCVSPYYSGLFRLRPPVEIDSAGHAMMHLDFNALPPAGRIVDGSTWNFQFWYRDPGAGGTGSNLTDAVQATFCP